MSDATILFVPGIGMPPQVFGPARWSLAHPSATWQRPGYRATEPVSGFRSQVEYLAASVAELRPDVVVGISAGATLALALVMDDELGAPLARSSVIAHEPFVGKLVPALDDAFRSWASQLGVDPDLSEINRFLDAIYGERHRSRFPPEWLERNAITIADEIRMIPEFQPTETALASLTTIERPVLVTVGERSDEMRHEVNDRLAALGLDTAEIPGSGHVLPMDQPDALVTLVEDELGRIVSSTAA